MKKKDCYSVYIVQCKFGTLYTGSTNNLERRLEEHNASRGAKYLRGRTPVKLVYSRCYPSLTLALKEEFRIKQLNRNQKQDLIKEGGGK